MCTCSSCKAPSFVCCYKCRVGEQMRGKRSRFEANWAVRNASSCLLPYKPDSCKEDTSGRPIMQIPKVHWPLQPEGMLPFITRLYTERTRSIKKKTFTHALRYNTQDTLPISSPISKFQYCSRKTIFLCFVLFLLFDICIFPTCSVRLY